MSVERPLSAGRERGQTTTASHPADTVGHLERGAQDKCGPGPIKSREGTDLAPGPGRRADLQVAAGFTEAA
jgi:hypothetical protein